MEEQPPHQIGKYTIRGQPGNGEFAHAYLAIDNQSDGDFSLSRISESTSGKFVYDLHLPDEKDSKEAELREFTTLLKNLKYDVKHIKAGISRNLLCRYTSVENDSQCRALIYIPAKILNDPDPVDLANFNMIGSFFDKNTIIIIISKSSEYPDERILRIVEDIWPAHVEFAPWKYIMSLIRDYGEIRTTRDEREREDGLVFLKKDVVKILVGMISKTG